jgi:hypothetical protein
VVVSGEGWIMVWTNTAGFGPEARPSTDPTSTTQLTAEQIKDLFSRLQVVNTASLPHAPLSGGECGTRLAFRFCDGCATTTLDYAVPESVTPEMEQVWAWFDQIQGINGGTNPRYYCSLEYGSR